MDVDVRRIARLAKLEIPEGRIEDITRQMEAIIGMVEHLPPLESAGALLDPADMMTLREDIIVPSIPREDILRNAPQAADGCFVVPKTVE